MRPVMPPFPCTLLVDDDEITNFINTMLLHDAGITQTLTAFNGQEALDVLHTRCSAPGSLTCPDLILLDIQMPVMDGFEFLQAYAQRPPADNPAVVIVLTSSHNPLDVARMQGLPIAGYLTKPLTEENIHRILQEHFGHAAPAS
jgi:CheY-like chemotaxis protein